MKQVIQNLGASSSLQESDCAPAPDKFISAEEVYAQLNARSPVIIGDTLKRQIGAIEHIAWWMNGPVTPPIPVRVVRRATRAEYLKAGGSSPEVRPYYHEIESVD